ncbi:hypothetical protein BN1708_018450 [Verticillium longisporum]|uniref:Uncharacterized protein n=1 Tax=Verticillium longisporum TaxID=100787 RepID=A0A0G4M755_VERLO|nr:hypothetical protein BN1708_018450 [Verticillium longisporum]
MGEPTSAGLHVAERREDQDQVGVLVAFVRSLSTKKALYLAKTEDLHFEKVGWDQGNIREVIVRLARGPFVTIECMSGRDVPTPSQPSILLCLLRRLHTPQKGTARTL